MPRAYVPYDTPQGEYLLLLRPTPARMLSDDADGVGIENAVLSAKMASSLQPLALPRNFELTTDFVVYRLHQNARKGEGVRAPVQVRCYISLIHGTTLNFGLVT